MQISSNSTSMLAGMTVSADKNGRDHCVVVVKGTFSIGTDGRVHLADEQVPFVYADQHYGDPATTSIQYECDFAAFKPRADVIVNGQAFSPSGQAVSEIMAGLEVGGIRKIIRVVGNRHWRAGPLGLSPSRPEPFVTLPMVYERAFGGVDRAPNSKLYGVELRNPVGTGFHKNSDPSAIIDTALPNLEDPKNPIAAWSDRPAPMGLGVIGRSWTPRIGFAGTYDDAWLKDCFPFLPADFDTQYFLSSAADQQVPFFTGGEVVRCANMAPQRIIAFAVPVLDLPVIFRFHARDVLSTPNLDTLIVEPDKYRFILVWRATVPLRPKMKELCEVLIGPGHPRRRNGKPFFRSLSELVEWRRRKDGG